jgi:hypothetical protein
MQLQQGLLSNLWNPPLSFLERSHGRVILACMGGAASCLPSLGAETHKLVAVRMERGEAQRRTLCLDSVIPCTTTNPHQLVTSSDCTEATVMLGSTYSMLPKQPPF